MNVVAVVGSLGVGVVAVILCFTFTLLLLCENSCIRDVMSVCVCTLDGLLEVEWGSSGGGRAVAYHYTPTTRGGGRDARTRSKLFFHF